MRYVAERSLRMGWFPRPLLIGCAFIVLVLVGLAHADLGVGVAQDEAVVRVIPPEEEVTVGESAVPVNIVVENVQNLAAYQFRLEFDPDVVEAHEDENGLPKVEEGDFLGSSGRGVECIGPESERTSVILRCVTLAPPVSMGGTPGPDGSGTLATVFLWPVAAGKSDLHLADVILVAAEIDEEGLPITIEHEAVDAVIRIAGGGGGFAWVVWGPVIGVGGAALIAAAGVTILRIRGRAAR